MAGIVRPGQHNRIGFVCTPAGGLEYWNDGIVEWWGIRPRRANWVRFAQSSLRGLGVPTRHPAKLGLFCTIRPPVPEIGFVLPKPVPCTIYHNSSSARHLPLPSLWRELGLFGAIARIPRPSGPVPRDFAGELGSFCTFSPRPACLELASFCISCPRGPILPVDHRQDADATKPAEANWVRLAHFVPRPRCPQPARPHEGMVE